MTSRDLIGATAYNSIHQWNLRHWEKTGVCENCKKPGKTQWANLSGEYQRDFSDWAELCSSCHALIDGRKGKRTYGLICLIESCEKKSRTLGLCPHHYYEQRKRIKV